MPAEHSMSCPYPEGCTCGASDWNNLEKECKALRETVSRLEKDWKTENLVIELLIVGGFVTREKVEEARQLLVFNAQSEPRR